MKYYSEETASKISTNFKEKSIQRLHENRQHKTKAVTKDQTSNKIEIILLRGRYFYIFFLS